MKQKIGIKNITAFLGISILIALLYNCGSSKQPLTYSQKEELIFNEVKADTVAIANEETEYEIIIIEPGFYTWLNSIARPEGYYSQNFLENRNQLLVINWNQRAMSPTTYNPDLYQMRIDYQPNIDYGYEVNYKLYNYFIFFQRKFNQRLGPFVPRI